jgi:xanthosine utilization system XapX-like protein
MMTTQSALPSEGMTVSLTSIIVLVCTLGFGAALGGFLAHFLAPGSGLALFIGLGVFPTVLLTGGFLVEELWFLRLWQHQPRRWNLEIGDSSASPATHAERQRSAAFLPLGLIAGAIGGLVIGLLNVRVPMLASLALFSLAGLGYGGVVYSLVQFSLLPSLGHGSSSQQQRRQRAKKHAPHPKRRFESGRPEF